MNKLLKLVPQHIWVSCMTCKRVKTTHVRNENFSCHAYMLAYHRDDNKNISGALNMADGNDKLLDMKAVAR